MRQIFFNIMGIAAIGYGFRADAGQGEPAYFLMIAIILFIIGYHFRYRAINKFRPVWKIKLLNWLTKDEKKTEGEKYPYLYS